MMQWKRPAVRDLSGLDVGDHHASGMQVYTLGCGIDLSLSLNFSATGRIHGRPGGRRLQPGSGSKPISL